jgi:hypothetical protein
MEQPPQLYLHAIKRGILVANPAAEHDIVGADAQKRADYISQLSGVHGTRHDQALVAVPKPRVVEKITIHQVCVFTVGHHTGVPMWNQVLDDERVRAVNLSVQ